jgi:hypothetical protein
MGHCVRVAVLGVLMWAAPVLGAEAAVSPAPKVMVPQPASVMVFAVCLLASVRRRRWGEEEPIS